MEDKAFNIILGILCVSMIFMFSGIGAVYWLGFFKNF